MRHYIALIHKEPGSDFGVSFPDFPGCVSAGATLAEAEAAAREALAGHVQLMIDEGEAIPEPSSLDVILVDPDNRDGTPVLVPIPSAVRALSINVTMPDDVLSRIDDYTRAHGLHRSEFLVDAALRAMGGSSAKQDA